MNSIATYGHHATAAMSVYGLAFPVESDGPTGQDGTMGGTNRRHRGGIRQIIKTKLDQTFHFIITIKLISENKRKLALSISIKSPIPISSHFLQKILIFQTASCPMPISAQIAKKATNAVNFTVSLAEPQAIPFELAATIAKKENIALTLTPKRHILLDPHELALLLHEN